MITAKYPQNRPKLGQFAHVANAAGAGSHSPKGRVLAGSDVRKLRFQPLQNLCCYIWKDRRQGGGDAGIVWDHVQCRVWDVCQCTRKSTP